MLPEYGVNLARCYRGLWRDFKLVGEVGLEPTKA